MNMRFHETNVGKYTNSAARGGGGSSRIGNLYERLVVVNHGCEPKNTD